MVLTRLYLALAVVPYAVNAQKMTPKMRVLPKSNQVYVKIILPIDPVTRDKDRPVVESWIAADGKYVRPLVGYADWVRGPALPPRRRAPR